MGLCTEITRYPVCDDVAVSATATRFIFADWCARATSGDAAAPPMSVMNCLRCISALRSDGGSLRSTFDIRKALDCVTLQYVAKGQMLVQPNL